MHIGDRIKQERERQGLSREALSKQGDFSAHTVYRIESELMPKPSFEIILKIVKILNMSIDKMYLEDE